KEADLNCKKILLVGGSRKERSTLREHLNCWGCRTLDASDGKDALSNLGEYALSKEPFNLVMIDFQIPGTNGFELAKEIRATEALNGVPIVLLTSVGKIGDGNICRDMGIDGYLSKPVDKDDLKGVIELVLTLSNGDEKLSERRLITRHTVAEEYKKEVRILLAEDYITNQKVAMKHLCGAGYQVDLAENGQQAVDLSRRKRYDLILMDIQMPKIGGFEATGEIRRLESQKLSMRGEINRMPIIAMTAHAMKGYRQRCIDAGMDDYISKPLKRSNLLALVEKWITSTAQGKRIKDQRTKEAIDLQPSIINRKSKDCAPLNFEGAVKEFEGDKEFLIEILGDFFGEVMSQTETIRQAISDDDSEVIRREAHAIKGGAANLRAEPLSLIAYELEKIGKSGFSAGGIEILERLEKEFHRLEEYTKGIQNNRIHL
ncbi:response regulator, partial [Thermodesulfobacteriota bacterium]